MANETRKAQKNKYNRKKFKKYNPLRAINKKIKKTQKKKSDNKRIGHSNKSTDHYSFVIKHSMLSNKSFLNKLQKIANAIIHFLKQNKSSSKSKKRDPGSIFDEQQHKRDVKLIRKQRKENYKAMQRAKKAKNLPKAATKVLHKANFVFNSDFDTMFPLLDELYGIRQCYEEFKNILDAVQSPDINGNRRMCATILTCKDDLLQIITEKEDNCKAQLERNIENYPESHKEELRENGLRDINNKFAPLKQCITNIIDLVQKNSGQRFM